MESKIKYKSRCEIVIKQLGVNKKSNLRLKIPLKIKKSINVGKQNTQRADLIIGSGKINGKRSLPYFKDVIME